MQAVNSTPIRSLSMVNLSDKKECPKKPYIGMKVQYKEINKEYVVNSYPLNNDEGRLIMYKSIFSRTPSIIKKDGVEKEFILYTELTKPDLTNIKNFYLNDDHRILCIKIKQSYINMSSASFYFNPKINEFQLYDINAFPRRDRIGSLLLYAGAIFAKHQKINQVTVCTALHNAYPFYKKFGFQDSLYNYAHWYADLETDTDSLLSKSCKMVDGFNIYQLQAQAINPYVKFWKSEDSIRY